MAPVAQPQEATLFQDSWFWGVHAGGTHIGTIGGSSGTNGTVGAEWLITRTYGGLYLAYDQANFTRTASIADPNAANGSRPITVHDMRTGSIAAVAFPVQLKQIRPYVGLGFAISVLGDATPLVLLQATPPLSASAVQQQNHRTPAAARRYSLLVADSGRSTGMALYGQVTVMPSTGDFLIDKTIMDIAVGVRYNFGSSIER